jgi:hypothetical protein
MLNLLGNHSTFDHDIPRVSGFRDMSRTVYALYNFSHPVGALLKLFRINC